MHKIDNKEVAYHEAGHAVVGFLFYPPVSVTIKREFTELGCCMGITNSVIPHPIVFESFDNELLFTLYVKIFLYSCAGEYFQRKISNKIDETGLKVDKDLLPIYFNGQQLKSFEFYKSNILELFFASEILNEMIDEVAKELLKKETLNHSDLESILSMYNFDSEQQIEQIMDEYYLLICKKYKEIVDM